MSRSEHLALVSLPPTRRPRGPTCSPKPCTVVSSQTSLLWQPLRHLTAPMPWIRLPSRHPHCSRNHSHDRACGWEYRCILDNPLGTRCSPSTVLHLQFLIRPMSTLAIRCE